MSFADVLLPRQTPSTNTSVTSCDAGFDIGQCIAANACPGIQYTARCAGPKTVKCCLIRECQIRPQSARGYCKDQSVQTCDGGRFVSGFCPGGDNIQCCVRNADLGNSTIGGVGSVTSTILPPGFPTTMISSRTSSIPGAAPTEPVTSPSTDARRQGLTGGQIGGIAAGAGIGAILVFLCAYLLFLLQKKQKKTRPPGNRDETMLQGEDIKELYVRPRFEMASGEKAWERRVELADETSPRDRSHLTARSELPGSPATETEAPARYDYPPEKTQKEPGGAP